MNENEKPVLGSSEAAVLACVDLIARAVQVSEERVSYYLDLYYQVRIRYEAEIRRMPMDDIFGCQPEARAETSPAPTERADPAGESAAGSKKNRG